MQFHDNYSIKQYLLPIQKQYIQKNTNLGRHKNIRL